MLIQGLIPAAQNQGGVLPGPNPLVIMLLVLAWIALLAAAAAFIVRFRPPQSVSRVAALSTAGLVAALAVALSIILSPLPPVLCTYTGLSHITSSYHVAALEWNWSFPTDYPLAVPVFASLFVKMLGQTPESFGLANTLLAAFGTAAVCLLALRLYSTLLAALFAGVATGTFPLLLLLAGGDSLTVGYMALSPWAILFALAVLQGGGKWDRRIAFSGLAAALVLVCQTRLEAPAFVGVVFLLLIPFSTRKTVLEDVCRLLRPAAVAVLISLPYFSLFYAEFVTGERLGQELGGRLAWRIALVAVYAVVLLSFAGYRRIKNRRNRTRIRFAYAGLLIACYCFFVLAEWGPAFFLPGPACFGLGCSGETFATIFSWHLNPKMTPLPLIFMFAAGFALFRDRRESRMVVFLLLWMAAILIAASTKATGELPFEGARTQLPATIPFVLIAAIGAREVVRSLARGWMKAGAILVVLLPFYPFCVGNATDLDYNQQREYGFFRSCLANVPRHSTVYAPDDVLSLFMIGDDHATTVKLYPLYRTGYMTEAMGTGGRGIRLRGISLFERQESESDDHKVFFMKNLNCYRTGRTGLNRSCAAAESELDLIPVCEMTIPNRMYTFDFYEPTRIVADEIELGLYEIRQGRGDVDAIP